MNATKKLRHVKPATALVLSARSAADLMTPNPLSVRDVATVAEAAVFLAGRGISAAPVIDEAGRPVGVVSRTDLLKHRGRPEVGLVGSSEYFERLERPMFHEEEARPGEATHSVRDVMTPVVFCVRPETPAMKVVEKMLALDVRRLFVVDDHSVLVGVISAVDVLGKLRPCLL